jgi:hypothetical protein
MEEAVSKGQPLSFFVEMDSIQFRIQKDPNSIFIDHNEQHSPFKIQNPTFKIPKQP